MSEHQVRIDDLVENARVNVDEEPVRGLDVGRLTDGGFA
jgi:hypothetical protein